MLFRSLHLQSGETAEPAGDWTVTLEQSTGLRATLKATVNMNVQSGEQVARLIFKAKHPTHMAGVVVRHRAIIRRHFSERRQGIFPD